MIVQVWQVSFGLVCCAGVIYQETCIQYMGPAFKLWWTHCPPLRTIERTMFDAVCTSSCNWSLIEVLPWVQANNYYEVIVMQCMARLRLHWDQFTPLIKRHCKRLQCNYVPDKYFSRWTFTHSCKSTDFQRVSLLRIWWDTVPPWRTRKGVESSTLLVIWFSDFPIPAEVWMVRSSFGYSSGNFS